MNKSIPLFSQGWPDEFVCMQVKNQANKQARAHTPNTTKPTNKETDVYWHKSQKEKLDKPHANLELMNNLLLSHRVIIH